jgi:hypothetical protein
MEVALAALLATGALLAHTLGRDALAALLLGLAALARPESLLLVPLIWLARPVTLSRTTTFAAIVGLCLAPWIAFNLATAGTPLPATASAKVEGGLVGALSGTTDTLVTALVGRPWQFEREWVVWLLSIDVLLPVLMLPGLWGLWRDGGRVLGVPALVLVLHPIGMALLAPYRGPGFQEGRYSIHLLPLAIAVAAVGIAVLTPAPRRPAESLGRSTGRRPAQDEEEAGPAPGPPRGRHGNATRPDPRVRRDEVEPPSAPRSSHVHRWERHARLALTGALLAGALSAFPDAALRYAWAVQNIDAMQVHLGRWIAAHTPPDARIALNDVGAIAYVSRREVVDVMGLVTPAIIPYRRDGEAGVLRYLERVRPDYLVIFPSWFPGLAAMTDRFRPVYRLRLENNTVSGGPEMVIYTTPWTRGAGGR